MIRKAYQGQLKVYSSRYYKKKNLKKALDILNNYEEFFISNNLNSYIFYLESLLLRMECLLQTSKNLEEIIILYNRFSKQLQSPQYHKIFKQTRERMNQTMKKVEREMAQLQPIVTK